MYFALPFVAPNHCLWIDRLIKEEECGLSADSASAISYANAISYLIENREEATAMGLNARSASEKSYLWTHMEEKLFKVYKTLELKQRQRAL
jgi:glycosyltransferase involved in cell wall biosynthesis